MDKDLIKRINELAKKKKTLGLNAEEQAEQKQLYAVYLAEIREQFDNTLDNVSIKQEDGSVVPFKSAAKKKAPAKSAAKPKAKTTPAKTAGKPKKTP